MKRCVLYIILFLMPLPGFLFAQTTGGKVYLLDNDEVNKPKISTLYKNKEGLILCGTNKGLYRFDGFDFIAYQQEGLTSTEVTAIYETTDKKLWVGFNNGNIGMLAHDKIIRVKFEEGLPKEPIRSITQDEQGVTWIATAGEGIYYLKNNRLYNINEDDGLSDNYVYKLIFLPKRGIV